MSEVTPRRRRASSYGRAAWTPKPGQADLDAPRARFRRVRAVWRRLPRRPLAVVLAVLEAVFLAWLITSPLFVPRHIGIVGLRRVPQHEVLAAAGVSGSASIFSLDGATIRRRLEGLPWVRAASVETAFPDSLLVKVTEWEPVAVYVAGPAGQPMYLNDQGAVLQTAPEDAGAQLKIQGPAVADPRVGERVLDQRLVGALVAMQRSFPGLFGGQKISSFQQDSCGNLVLLTARGWRVLFGRTSTPDQVSALGQKLGAVKAVATAVNLNSGQFDYVNVMNPDEPAVHKRSGSRSVAAAPLTGTTTISINGGIEIQPCR